MNVPQPSSFMVPVEDAPFIPLSAVYPYDEKTSFKPELYQYKEGYSLFTHPVFTNIKDVKLGKDTFMNLTSTMSLADILTDQSQVKATDLVIFSGLRASNNRYVTSIGETLYATATSVGANEFFVVKGNYDGTYSVQQNGKYWTVNQESPWDITLQNPLVNDTAQVQKFNIYASLSGFTIQTLFEAPWWESTNTPPRYLNRFVTFAHSTTGLYAIGLTPDDDYMAKRSYVFYSTNDLGAFAIGYDGILKWVRYFNEVGNEQHTDGTYKFENRSVNIYEIVKNVLHNYLITTPYKSQINVERFDSDAKVGKMGVELVNLKNVMTPEYEYTVKETEI